MTDIESKQNHRLIEPFTLEQFRQRYCLSWNEARELFEKVGPSGVELSLLMASKGRLLVD
ncbi:hypothetical protein QO002_005880 [Pararhizobium capsulatum DSM 1112]|uniref:Uncharacterized protein n=1 Tax=Pararhizobium capsulatum DSM 1112 TaxID=1121113 RepID=A0ABU0BZI5_9HYPH|nr:hypothetical protein [Pararhizobium capsulatum DSM 1112]